MANDRFWTCDLETLLKWALAGEEQGEIFGIHKNLFFVPKPDDPFRMGRYGQVLETPLGVAAGPHTQLSQNILAAWLCGARYIELKTVQVLDELEVTKPCIDMADEGYNCEWSQELKLDQSFDEYLNAWIMVHILKDRLGWGKPDELGCIFNMSVGYNLEGIQSPTVQRFLDLMGDCSEQKAAKIAGLAKFYPRAAELDIPDCISNNLTISTMHGCPPHEVEKIARYFVEERRLHTTIKLNPTLLGPDGVRGILNRSLGYRVEVPDLAFEHDLKWPDGVKIIRAMQASAKTAGVDFNLKLTNTLETSNRDQNLPDNEQMVYMSGRPLHAISINLAARLQNEFKGGLDISFSAGVDACNFTDTLACGLKPLTVCSDVLKPGGYGRLSQYLELAARAMADRRAGSLEEFASDGGQGSALDNLQKYAEKVVQNPRYAKAAYEYNTIKNRRPLPFFDCAAAPCVIECPAGQEVPRYIDYIAQGRLDDSLATIMATNPFPNMQGKVCDHKCQYQCTRLNYDEPLLIRELKRAAAEGARGGADIKPAAPNGKKAAVIGAGPSGMSCAYFLALGGFSVELFETKAFPGGMAADAIPAFRLDDAALKLDLEGILALGVKLHTGAKVDADRFAQMIRDYDYIYIAVGAQKSISLDIPGMDAGHVFDQLGFLSAVRQGKQVDLGSKVAVIGGGNSAMDAARAAKRLVGPDGRVSIVYRRTSHEMPADREEVLDALEEGIELLELCAPEQVVIGPERLTGLACARMELGGLDASGRPSPVKVPGSSFTLEIDSLIPAIGQKVVLDFLPGGELKIDPSTCRTGLDRVYAGGDAVRGASSLIMAIGDGQKAAASILAASGAEGGRSISPAEDREPDWDALKLKQARRMPGARPSRRAPLERLDFALYVHSLDEKTARAEAQRCLQCDVFCNICTTVCPNRANIAFEMGRVVYPVQTARAEGGRVAVETLDRAVAAQKYQIINLADFCNECGNCTTFCPSADAPYLDKPRFHLSRDSYESSDRGYYFASPDRLLGKLDGGECSLTGKNGAYVWESSLAKVSLNDAFEATHVEFNENVDGAVSLEPAVRMAMLYKAARKAVPVSFSMGLTG